MPDRPCPASDPRTSFGWYAALSRRLPPPLPRARAVELARDVEAGVLAAERLVAAHDRTPSPTEARDLRELVTLGDRAHEALFLGTLRLVFHWTKGTAAAFGVDAAQDAFQVGCLGLATAIRRWDHRRGGAFSTYASWCIRDEVRRWRAAQERPETCTVQPSRDDGDDAGGAGDDAGWDGGLGRVDEHCAAVQSARAALGRLDPRHADVLRRRHGLTDGVVAEPMTLQAIGAVLGVTRERVRQLERDALAALR